MNRSGFNGVLTLAENGENEEIELFFSYGPPSKILRLDIKIAGGSRYEGRWSRRGSIVQGLYDSHHFVLGSIFRSRLKLYFSLLITNYLPTPSFYFYLYITQPPSLLF
jgi:hypothetical protein